MVKYQLRFNVPFVFYSIQEYSDRPPRNGIEFPIKQGGRKDWIELEKLDFYDEEKRVVILKDGWKLYPKNEIRDELADVMVIFHPPPEHRDTSSKAAEQYWERLIFSVDPEGKTGLLAEVKDLETGEILWPWPA